MDQSKSLEENLNKFQKIVVDLNNINEKISDENQAIILLNSLPETYREVKAAIKYGRDSLTMSIVLDALKTRYLEIKKERKDGELLMARGRRYDSVEALMVSHRDIQNAWIRDSGCTYHMTPNRDFFINFQKSDGGKVLLGDNVTCEVKGTGSVLIATHDGMIRMLTNVRYVPELKRNPISVGELDTSGYTIKFENGIMKVTKGSLVKLRETLRNGLYVLEGTAVSGSATKALKQQKQQIVDHVVTDIRIDGERTLIDEGVCSDSIASDLKKQRKDAMEAELFILRKNRTWSLVTKPSIQKLIQPKWFKQGGDSKPRYKARLVAKVLPAHRFNTGQMS
ncbi:hypothetical protein E5676_scaffold360G00940 [Cucumis melo var. makuwa]|uniref:Retrovirus-related Pol polyprotein from transposon TNT 1-94-like beta-barrel domain-containing protein n=1 Tax=Cucumis melo var. makuwa TaxID=1194695 RepID=A0A5D3BP49_CUCMM|nr:hypothetical protein E6C27_scaffold147G00070 [Cucumis melo var. makuwa]TYK00046.1 hypothetical protein E5676_scaffold360G00940 [Cucumis melo var. makuwa]